MGSLTLEKITEIPTGLLEIKRVTDLHTIISQPTLLFLEGQKKEALFVSVLLHANEDTGFFAIQELLKRYQDKTLPRSLIIFFGNMAATKHEVRRLEGQPDYNRVWPGSTCPESEEKQLMREVVENITKQPLFASIDVHNNTGENPHYGCINSLRPEFMHLASLFSKIVVFFETPKGVQSMAMAKYCPSTTIECGKPHVSDGVEHACNYIDTVMRLESMQPEDSASPNNIDIYHTVARVTVPKDCSFDFGKEACKTDTLNDICFPDGFDQLNFSELEANSLFGCTQHHNEIILEAWNDDIQDVSDEFFTVENDKLLLKKSVMPAMISLDKTIIRQDCLCYLMERLN